MISNVFGRQSNETICKNYDKVAQYGILNQ